MLPLYAVATIGFQPETYRDREASEVINVTVAVLTGTLSREVVVRIYSIDSSAKCENINFVPKLLFYHHDKLICLYLAPNDYKSFNETLTFDSEKTMLVFPVRIINDGVDEEDEQLLSRLQLEPVEGDSPNVRIQVQPNVTTLTIVDDDGKSTNYATYSVLDATLVGFQKYPLALNIRGTL